MAGVGKCAKHLLTGIPEINPIPQGMKNAGWTKTRCPSCKAHVGWIDTRTTIQKFKPKKVGIAQPTFAAMSAKLDD